MFCPACGRENPGAFGYCNFCGNPLSSMPEPRVPETRMQETPLQETAMPEERVKETATQKTRPAVSPRPRVSAPQTISRRKKWNPGVIAIIVIGLAGVAGAVAFLAGNLETPEQRIGRLMREAADLQPVKQAFFASDRQFDDTFRVQFRSLFRVNREFIVLQNKVNANEIAKIGSPESFTDPDYAAEGL